MITFYRVLSEVRAFMRIWSSLICDWTIVVLSTGEDEATVFCGCSEDVADWADEAAAPLMT